MAVNDNKKMLPIPASTWISWSVGMIVTAVTLTAFAFTTFRTESKSKDFESRVEKRLEKIENKLDRLIEKQ